MSPCMRTTEYIWRSVCIARGDFAGRLLVWFDLVLLHVVFSCIRFWTPGVCGPALD